MTNETRRIPGLKLRNAIGKTELYLGEKAGSVIKKRKVFTYFLLYRLTAALIMPAIIMLYVVIGRYVDTGRLNITLFSGELYGASFICTFLIILFFRKKTSSIRELIDSIVEKKEFTDDLIIRSYSESFEIPAYITLREFILSVLFILLPVLIMKLSGCAPEGVTLKEIALAWWLGTISLLITSFIFSQLWVERTLERLYDHGVRISSDAGIKRNASIYIRLGVFTGAIIITMILLYANMLYMLSLKIPGHSSKYMLQVAFMSCIILAGTYALFRLVFSSIKRSFDILMYKMKAVQEGDYSVRIMNHRDDQIGQLYDSFDYLVSTLNGVLMSLESEVQKRTARLEEITSKISRYVSPQLYSKIYSEEIEPSLSYSRKKLTVFFSDIAGFTGTSEHLAPEDLSRILNQYLDRMAGIALKWGGTIYKYIGDAIMIFFGDPEYTNDRDHAVRCTGMALEMLGALGRLQEEWDRSGITLPLHVRMGINTGYCTVGNFGSESRMDYTAIGGTVNLASRLESAAPVDGILIAEATYLLIKNNYRCIEAGHIQAKGIDLPVKTYRVINDETEKDGSVSSVNIPGFRLEINPSELTTRSKDEIRKLLERVSKMIN